jgi:hypothetical protein
VGLRRRERSLALDQARVAAARTAAALGVAERRDQKEPNCSALTRAYLARRLRLISWAINTAQKVAAADTT